MPDALRSFISYSTDDRASAAVVKEFLQGFGIQSFMAHEDLHVSDEWRHRILEELQRMHVFVALLSKAFKSSDWAPQELGIAVSRRDVSIIPLSLDGTVSYGFIDNLQSKPFVDPLTDVLFVGPLQRRYPRHVIPVLVQRLRDVRSFRGAEARMESLRPFYKEFIPVEVDAFVEACIANKQIWDAGLCASEYIPEFITATRHHIRAAQLVALEYQITTRKRHADSAADEA